MTNRIAPSRLQLTAAIAAAVSLAATSYAAEVNPAAMVYKTPDQFTWRDPTDKATTNQTILYGDPNGTGLYIYINKFKPGRFGLAHYHPNDRFIIVTDGAVGEAPERSWTRSIRCGCRRARSRSTMR
jgi:hypothetical protein